MSILVAACGDGGSSPTPTPAPSNSAPRVTSANSASVAENTGGAILTLAATDADGDTVGFAITGGADASFFTLSGASLSFTSSPNFDAYADSNRDNVFEVTVQASDGRGGVASQPVAVTVTNDREGISVKRIATGFDEPAAMSLLYSQTLLIAEKDGTIWSLDTGTGARDVFDELNLTAGRELIDVASNVIGATPLFPVALIRDGTGMHLVTALRSAGRTEFTVASGAPDGARGAVGYVTGNGPGSSGRLLIAIGDPSGQRAQTPGGYGSASFLSAPSSTSTAADLVPFAIGLRNPAAIFNEGNSFFLSDQGGSEAHEINFVQAGISQGVNFGWPFVEGGVTVRSGGPSNLFAPDFTYRFGTGPLAGQGTRGGVSLATGSVIPASLANRFLVGDENGSIFAFGLAGSVPALENRSRDLTPDVGTIDSVVDIMRDASGRVFILDADGELFRLDIA